MVERSAIPNLHTSLLWKAELGAWYTLRQCVPMKSPMDWLFEMFRGASEVSTEDIVNNEWLFDSLVVRAM